MEKNNHFNFKFKNSMVWNGFESFATQALVTAHHLMLQLFSGAEFHGLFASYVSIIYTFIPIFNFGFDYSLSLHLQKFVQTKKNFRSMIFFQFIPQLITTFILAHLIAQPFIYKFFFNPTMTPEIAFWLKTIFIVEYIRKSTRSFLQLMLHTKATAVLEIFGTIFYMGAFWAMSFILGIQPTLLMSFKLLAASTLLQTLILLINVLNIYTSLDSYSNDLTDSNLNYAHKNLNKTRMGIWTNHILSQINYSNFVIPFASACFGPAQASTLAILLNSARCIKLFFQKGLGVSSLALLAQPKDQLKSPKDSRYSYPIYYLYNFSAPLMIFFLINSSKLSYWFSSNQIVWHLASIACFLSVIEGVISVYEKFYIAEKRIILFSAINTIGSIILFGLVYKFHISTTLIQFFLFFFLTRICVLTITIALSHYILKFTPPPSFNATILSTAIIISVFFYLLF